jgi:hypothetical protein
MVSMDTLSNSVMTGIYNQITGANLTKFRDHATAVRRLDEVLEREGMILISTPTGVEAVQPATEPQDVPVAKRGRGRPRAVELSGVITVLASGANRRRWGSTQKLFDLHTTGLNVSEYVELAVSVGFKAGQAYSAVRRDLARGDIEVG